MGNREKESVRKSLERGRTRTLMTRRGIYGGGALYFPEAILDAMMLKC
jgi:hypothetical protein